MQGGWYPYVYVDGIYLRRSWGGEYENVAVLVAISVNVDGYRKALGTAEGMKEGKTSWVNFFQWLKGRGLDSVRLIVGDKCPGMLKAVGEVFPDVKYQRCAVHFYRKHAQRDAFESLKTATNEDIIQPIIDKLKEKYLVYKDRINRQPVIVSKLVLSNADRQYFEDIILNRQPTESRNSHKKLP